MSNESLKNILEFLAAIIALSVASAVFAGLLYLLIRGKLEAKPTLIVKLGNNEQNGIPFYIKKGRIIQETSYLEVLATYTIKAVRITNDDPDKPANSNVEYIGVKTLSLSSEAVGNLALLSEKLNQATQAAGKLEHQQYLWNEVRSMFEKLPHYTGELPHYTEGQLTDNRYLEGNIFKEEAYVDYSQMYYLNKLQPLIGSSEIDIELAADGTLNKVSAKSEDSTVEKLMGLLPTNGLTAQPEAQPQPAGTQMKQPFLMQGPIYEFTLLMEYHYIRHVFSKAGDISKCTAIQPVISNGEAWYHREVVTNLKREPDTKKADGE